MATEQLPDVEANLKRSITLPQAMGVSFHQIVGGGVIALMGTAIALTGGGAPLAFVIAAAAVVVYSLPLAALGSAMPVTGGRYTYAARLFSPTWGFATMWFSVLVTVQLSLMALAGAQYVHALAPAIPVRPLALLVMTVFFLTNLAGSTFSNRIGIVLGVIMLVAFLLYAGVGLRQVQWETFTDLAPHGTGNLLTAAALLTFAVTGSSAVAEIGREMKQPGRDIPVSMIGGIVIAVALYVLMAIPSVGVLGAEQTAGKPMTLVADNILSPAGFAFFVLGGAMVSVIGHINSLLLTATKPVLAAVGDGWFPARLGAVNKRFGTPHWLLLLLYVIGVTPVLAGFSVAAIAGMASVALTPVIAIMIIASCRLRARYPHHYADAPFRMRRGIHLTTVVIGVAVLAVQDYLLIGKLTIEANLALLLWTIVGFTVWVLRHRRVAAASTPAPAASGSPA
ncbi:APC family permease [Saccharopolyspora shandongensis]|uniref:APC family permease n=1 Tax=Saccharopolyspora shandongensis TaxID=418495 RepID=UPI0033E357DF